VPLCGFAPPHFAVAGLCYAKPFYAATKRQLPVTLCAIAPGNNQNIENCASNSDVTSDLKNQMTNSTGRVQFWLPWRIIKDARFGPYAGKVEVGSPTDELIRAYHATRPTYGGWHERPPDRPGSKSPQV